MKISLKIVFFKKSAMNYTKATTMSKYSALNKYIVQHQEEMINSRNKERSWISLSAFI